MPPPLLYPILFLTVCCLSADADTNLDSSQQQPPTTDYYYAPSPTNLLANNILNSDFSTPTTSTDTTFGINDSDLQSSSQQQQPPEQQVNADVGSPIAPPSGTWPLLLSSDDECDQIQNSGGNLPKAGGQRKRKRKRQSQNCPNPYSETPNSQANSVWTREGDDDDHGRTHGGEDGQAPSIAIPGLLLQTKPQPNLSLCPDVERPIPVCARDDTKVPMGDSWLIQKCRPCKRLFFLISSFPHQPPPSPPPPPPPTPFRKNHNLIRNNNTHPISPPPLPSHPHYPGRVRGGGKYREIYTHRYTICRL